ncbi:dihydroxy-acid dehydratase [Agromyces bauzanensis]
MSQREIQRSGGDLFDDPGQDGLIHRGFLRAEGLGAAGVRRRPVIGIATSRSELNPCNFGLDLVSVAVKAGVKAAGGLALEFPTISISEPFTRPTSMLLRNLMAMDVEEMIASSPIDGVVLLGGCDKTVPAQLMGAISAGKPALMVTAGPRPLSCWRGEDFAIDDLWPAVEQRSRGLVSDGEWDELEEKVNPGPGTCNVMGTAASMALVAEVLGFALPGSSLPPAADPRRSWIAEATGHAIVAAVLAHRVPTVDLAALENAVRVVCGVGGSTNALIHLEAIAGRAGLRIGTDRLTEWARTTPLVADVRPVGARALSELDAAGGLPAVLRALGSSVHDGVVSATGESWRAIIDRTPHSDASVIGAIAPRGAITVLIGSLAPRGAVIKGVVDDRTPTVRRGPALVFDGVADLNARIDDPDLPVSADTVLVLRGVGPIGASMPEVGHIPVPARLLAEGVTDMVRVTDARMSGTASGTVVLHVAPEAAVGGPLALVVDGDLIELDLASGRLDLLVDPRILAAREAASVPTLPMRGYGWLAARYVGQADEGCDLDFLTARFAGGTA